MKKIVLLLLLLFFAWNVCAFTVNGENYRIGTIFSQQQLDNFDLNRNVNLDYYFSQLKYYSGFGLFIFNYSYPIFQKNSFIIENKVFRARINYYTWYACIDENTIGNCQIQLVDNVKNQINNDKIRVINRLKDYQTDNSGLPFNANDFDFEDIEE